MTKLASLLFTASLLVLLLAGCNIRPPFTVFISAANYGAESSLERVMNSKPKLGDEQKRLSKRCKR